MPSPWPGMDPAFGAGIGRERELEPSLTHAAWLCAKEILQRLAPLPGYAA